MCCLFRAPVKKDELLCFSTTGGPMKSDFDFSVIERRFGSDCNLPRITRREVRSFEASWETRENVQQSIWLTEVFSFVTNIASLRYPSYHPFRHGKNIHNQHRKENKFSTNPKKQPKICGTIIKLICANLRIDWRWQERQICLEPSAEGANSSGNRFVHIMRCCTHTRKRPNAWFAVQHQLLKDINWKNQQTQKRTFLLASKHDATKKPSFCRGWKSLIESERFVS